MRLSTATFDADAIASASWCRSTDRNTRGVRIARKSARCSRFVGDATSRLVHLRFVASESTFDYFCAARTYLETHGKPVAFYSDKHSVFRVNAKDATGGDGATQFSRALTELNIDILCANSPQAKGRVERVFGTLQDRLVKELRLAGISTIEAANAWLPGFVEDYNKRFGRVPANAKKSAAPPDGGRRSRTRCWPGARSGRSPAILHCATTG
jgi:hypothetical protein